MRDAPDRAKYASRNNEMNNLPTYYPDTSQEASLLSPVTDPAIDRLTENLQPAIEKVTLEIKAGIAKIKGDYWTGFFTGFSVAVCAWWLTSRHTDR